MAHSILPANRGMNYFDHNATAPLHPAAREAWLEAAEKFIGNPSSPHRIGNRADAALEDARARLAGMMGCRPHEIVWTSGATEANNQVLHHFAGALPPDATACILAIEHPSVSRIASRVLFMTSSLWLRACGCRSSLAFLAPGTRSDDRTGGAADRLVPGI